MDFATVGIAIISSSIFSAIINVLFLKNYETWIDERSRRFSVIFGDRYLLYKDIFNKLLEISEITRELPSLGKEGYWTAHYHKMRELVSKNEDIQKVIKSNNLIIEDDILILLDKVNRELRFYKSIIEDDSIEMPDDASINPKYYHKLLDKSENIESVINESRNKFKKMFLKKY